MRQGEPGDSLFVIVSGRVQVAVTPADGGAERTVATIEPGDYVGEMSLLTGAPRSATVRTLEETESIVLRREVMRPVLLADPAVAQRLSETLAKRRGIHDLVAEPSLAAAPVPGPDAPGYLLARIRRFFGLADEG